MIRNSKKSSTIQSGFTLVELVVIIGIIGFMSAAVLSSQNKGADQRRLILETRKLAQNIRKVQNSALSSTIHNCGGSNKVVSFGIILDEDTADRYLLSADCNEDKIYDAGSDPLVATVILTDTRLSNVSPKNGGNALEVYFVPPLPVTAVNTNVTDSASGTITLCGIRDTSLCRNIYINARGAVSIQ